MAKIKDRDIELVSPRGRKGRIATNFLISFVSQGQGEASIEQLLELTVDDDFLGTHLPQFMSTEDAKFVDENATTGELLQLVTDITTDVFAGFQAPEVDAALKNLKEAQGEDQEEQG